MRIWALCLLSGCLWAQDQVINERMRVVHYVLEVRALDAKSRPLLDLDPEDFLLKDRGRVVKVNTAYWVEETLPPPRPVQQEAEEVEPEPMPERAKPKPPPVSDHMRLSTGFVDMSLEPIKKERTYEPLPAPLTGPDAPDEPDEPDEPDAFEPEIDRRDTAGRMMVLFVQNDIGSNRNQGLVHMIHHGKKMIDRLNPKDWVAVFSFDSHLKMHLDFTRDKAKAKKALNRCLKKVPGRILFGGPQPSIADDINIDEADDAAYVERGLEIVARALENQEGEKLLAFLGWGFGNMDRTGVILDKRYDKMLEAMFAANVTVFSLDITMAEYHTLETSLKNMAQQTGGFYERTANHPELSVRRFLSSIEGYYVISFSLPETGKPPKLDLRIAGYPKARVAFSRDFQAYASVRKKR